MHRKHTHTHIQAHTTFAGLFYKDYAGDYMGRFYWLFPHSSLSVSLLFFFKTLALYFTALSRSFFLLKSSSRSLYADVEMYVSGEYGTAGSPILTFQSRF